MTPRLRALSIDDRNREILRLRTELDAAQSALAESQELYKRMQKDRDLWMVNAGKHAETIHELQALTAQPSAPQPGDAERLALARHYLNFGQREWSGDGPKTQDLIAWLETSVRMLDAARSTLAKVTEERNQLERERGGKIGGIARLQSALAERQMAIDALVIGHNNVQEDCDALRDALAESQADVARLATELADTVTCLNNERRIYMRLRSPPAPQPGDEEGRIDQIARLLCKEEGCVDLDEDFPCVLCEKPTGCISIARLIESKIITAALAAQPPRVDDWKHEWLDLAASLNRLMLRAEDHKDRVRELIIQYANVLRSLLYADVNGGLEEEYADFPDAPKPAGWRAISPAPQPAVDEIVLSDDGSGIAAQAHLGAAPQPGDEETYAQQYGRLVGKHPGTDAGCDLCFLTRAVDDRNKEILRQRTALDTAQSALAEKEAALADIVAESASRLTRGSIFKAALASALDSRDHWLYKARQEQTRATIAEAALAVSQTALGIAQSARFAEIERRLDVDQELAESQAEVAQLTEEVEFLHATDGEEYLPCGHHKGNVGDTGACGACNDSAAARAQAERDGIEKAAQWIWGRDHVLGHELREALAAPEPQEP